MFKRVLFWALLSLFPFGATGQRAQEHSRFDIFNGNTPVYEANHAGHLVLRLNRQNLGQSGGKEPRGSKYSKFVVLGLVPQICKGTFWEFLGRSPGLGPETAWNQQPRFGRLQEIQCEQSALNFPLEVLQQDSPNSSGTSPLKGTSTYLCEVANPFARMRNICSDCLSGRRPCMLTSYTSMCRSELEGTGGSCLMLAWLVTSENQTAGTSKGFEERVFKTQSIGAGLEV